MFTEGIARVPGNLNFAFNRCIGIVIYNVEVKFSLLFWSRYLMPCRTFAHWEPTSVFERDRSIVLKKIAWTNQKIGRFVRRSRTAIRRFLHEYVNNMKYHRHKESDGLWILTNHEEFWLSEQPSQLWILLYQLWTIPLLLMHKMQNFTQYFNQYFSLNYFVLFISWNFEVSPT